MSDQFNHKYQVWVHVQQRLKRGVVLFQVARVAGQRVGIEAELRHHCSSVVAEATRLTPSKELS